MSPTKWLAGPAAALFAFAGSDAALAQSERRDGSLPPVTVVAPDQLRRQRVTPPRASNQRRTQRAAVRAAPVVTPPALVGLPAASLGPTPAPGRGDVSSSVTALPAATTVIDNSFIARAPIATYGDLFRSLPGFNVSNYGQGAVGYGLSLRGYTEAEHGRDIAYFIDGVPLNEVSSIHTPNYADLNILLPETVERVEIVRGPFNIEAGDSNLGGSVNIITKTAEPFATAGISGGTQGTVRGVGTYSTTQGGWLPYLAIEGYRTDGYRENSFVDRYNSFNKISTVLPNGATVSLRAQAYGTEYGAPGYSNRDGIRSGLVDERAATNVTDGGRKNLENFVANYSQGAAGQELKGTLYVSHDVFTRFADFGGGQRGQRDERTTTGGRVSKVWSGAVGNDIPVQLLLGGNWRVDGIDAFQAPSTARQFTGAPVVNVGLTQTNLAGFGQLQIKPVPWLKLTGGARVDQFYYDINDRLNPGATPNISPTVVSPKGGIAITPVRWLELFANYGEGFRSIDVPLELIGNPGIKPFKVRSAEGGARITVDRFKFLASYWSTRSENESFQPAPGLPVTFLGKAEREGVDLDARAIVYGDRTGSVALFANASIISARLLDAAPSFFVPNVPKYIANAGIEFDVPTVNAQRLSGSAFVTFVGKKNLTQDGLIETSPYQRITAKVAYSWPEGWTAFTQATVYAGDRLSEIAINFGNPTGATSGDIFVSAQPRFTVLGGLSYRFPTAVASAAPAYFK